MGSITMFYNDIIQRITMIVLLITSMILIVVGKNTTKLQQMNDESVAIGQSNVVKRLQNYKYRALH